MTDEITRAEAELRESGRLSRRREIAFYAEKYTRARTLPRLLPWVAQNPHEPYGLRAEFAGTDAATTRRIVRLIGHALHRCYQHDRHTAPGAPIRITNLRIALRAELDTLAALRAEREAA